MFTPKANSKQRHAKTTQERETGGNCATRRGEQFYSPWRAPTGSTRLWLASHSHGEL